ncbi:MAG TPA: thioredoxin [Chitinivibrionales bacterium]|nr:thioredoxin [Chitinivibrionales bacterium]
MIPRFMMIITALTALCLAQPLRQAAPEKMPLDSSDILADMIVKSKVPVLVDFWAPWCMPCRMLTPTIEELKKKYAGKIKVMKINVDVQVRIAAYFRVSSIPAVFFIKEKSVVLYIPGLRPKEDYETAIAEVLALKMEPPDTTQKKQPAPAQPDPKSPATGK